MNKFFLEILTPERIFYSGEVGGLVVASTEGEICILANHEPIVIALNPSTLRINDGGKPLIASHGEGFVEVTPSKTVVLCQTVEWPEEIEINRVKRAIEEHEKKIRETKSLQEYRLSKATLARAFARLRVIDK